MARIRTIKPEYWSDEKLAPLDPLTRLVFLGLISHADDAGRLIDSVKQLDGLLFPFTDDTCSGALEILARLSRVSRYTSESGQPLIQIVGWTRHQRVDKPAKYTLPPPSPEVHKEHVDTKPSREPRENVATISRSDLRPTTYDHGPTSEDAHDAFADLDGVSVMAIKGLYGWRDREGTDTKLWNGAPPDERERMIAIAVQRLRGEGKAYQGKLFRRILESVIEEQHQPVGATADRSHWED